MTWFTLALSLSGAEARAPLEIEVTDPKVLAVVLECGRETMKSMVKEGVATFPEAPRNTCTVNFVRKSGTLNQPGRWICGLDGCTQEDVHHREISDAVGRINVVMTREIDASASLELTCSGSGYRERRNIEENTAVFDNVPDEDCLLLFKGGVPARYNRIRWGTYYCSLTGTTAVCTRQ